MMHGRTGLVTFPRVSAENQHKNRVRHACSLLTYIGAILRAAVLQGGGKLAQRINFQLATMVPTLSTNHESRKKIATFKLQRKTEASYVNVFTSML
jgi:hypothetical protein